MKGADCGTSVRSDCFNNDPIFVVIPYLWVKVTIKFSVITCVSRFKSRFFSDYQWGCSAAFVNLKIRFKQISIYPLLPLHIHIFPSLCKCMYFTTYSIQHLLIFPAITFSVPSIPPLNVLPWETGILIHAARVGNFRQKIIPRKTELTEKLFCSDGILAVPRNRTL
jgi:hypothetical protein